MQPPPNGSTWDGNPNATPPVTTPYRPGLDDVAGGALANGNPPPNPQTHPSAEVLNTVSKTMIAMGKVVANAVITVDFNAGAPFIAAVSAASSGIAPGTFTPTDNGAGDTSITWPAGTFPPAVADPTMSINGDVEIDRQRVVTITNGVRVKTKLGTTGTDVRYTVVIY